MTEGTASPEDQRLLAEMNERIGDAGGPALAFALIMQKQALEDRINFGRWLAETRALASAGSGQEQKVAAAQQTSRRAEMRLSSM